ncbi:hypothetical protein GZ212_11845 [Mangrovimonas sp. CR14]|uniref:hypothetical protein n=1 Tax=Mangrovimonas sp. CR14 TaxID=2706120 RepID=UPI001423953B|nr:hypothetical protein [Mangrovimonas sp. CR14]NIK92847.1 hypothetical protein [Mangrovimonas sp. CR14]
MTIDINQHKIAISDKYNIYVDNELTYKSRTKLFRFFLSEIILSNFQDRQIATIERKFDWLKAKYIFSGHDVGDWTFRTIRIWKMHYKCQIGKDSYDIYGHKGRKVSIFKNDQQIAWFDKSAVSWFEGDNYHLIANDNCNPILLTSFVLIWDNFFNNDSENSTVTYDFGNIGPEARKFDRNWRPKKEMN